MAQPKAQQRASQKHMAKDRDRSLTKGFLAGLAGGLAGTVAKVIGEKLLPPRTQGQTPPPLLVVARTAAAADVDVPATAEKSAAEALHWTFGTLTGGVYGAVVEYQPHAAAWQGGAFGLTLNRLTHEGILPQATLVEPVQEQPAQERVSEWVTHVMYGVTTELVRRAVRKRL